MSKPNSFGRMWRAVAGADRLETRRGRRGVGRAPGGRSALAWTAVLSATAGLATLVEWSQLALAETPSDEATLAAVESGSVGAELIVDLDDHLDEARVRSLSAELGARFAPASSYVGADRVYRVTVAGTGRERVSRLSQLLSVLRRDPKVEAADWAITYQIPESAPTALTGPQALPVPQLEKADSEKPGVFVPNDPKYRYQWHLDQLRMPEAWMKGQGAGVVVAVLDTGVTPVEDLRGTELVEGYNFADNNTDTSDDHGHGTHVAGTIAQSTNNGVGVAGVAFRARIMPIKVLSGSGSGSVSGIAEGIRWATDHGAKVINMSLGGPFYSQVLARAVRYAHDHGVTVVCAAGNDGRGKVSYPAANRGALAVAATQFDETTTFYSNWGEEIAVAAPGGNTRVDQNDDGLPDGVLQNTVTPGNITKHDYLLFMGTSMASPHVAGVAALIVGAGVQDPEQVRKILVDTARRPKSYRGKHDPHYGAGIVDARAALELLQPERSAQVGAGTGAGAPSSPRTLLGFGALAALLLLAAYRLSSGKKLTPST